MSYRAIINVKYGIHEVLSTNTLHPETLLPGEAKMLISAESAELCKQKVEEFLKRGNFIITK